MSAIPDPHEAVTDQAADGRPRRPRRARGRVVTAVLLAVVCLAALALAVLNRLDRPAGTAAGKTLAVELTSGQCIDEDLTLDRTVEALWTVPCDRPHRGEVTAVLSLPGRELPEEAALERECAGKRWDYAHDALRLPDDVGYQFIMIHEHMKVVCLLATEQDHSGSLRQDNGNLSTKQKAYYAATRDLEMLLTTWPAKAVADAPDEHREHARQVAEAVTGTRMAIDRYDWGKMMTPLVDKYRLELDKLTALAQTVRTDRNTATVEQAVADVQDLAFGPANRNLRMDLGLSG